MLSKRGSSSVIKAVDRSEQSLEAHQGAHSLLVLIKNQDGMLADAGYCEGEEDYIGKPVSYNIFEKRIYAGGRRRLPRRVFSSLRRCNYISSGSSVPNIFEIDHSLSQDYEEIGFRAYATKIPGSPSSACPRVDFRVIPPVGIISPADSKARDRRASSIMRHGIRILFPSSS
jgi:hypothetical protein